MRALVVVNPASTTASPRTVEVLLAALEGELKLDIVETTGRGHASALAKQARNDGMDVVIALGGDGTVNEVVNGLLAEGTHPSLPMLAVVPGGGANVFARALGLPREPIEATGQLLVALRRDSRRSIGLGHMTLDSPEGEPSPEPRWFTFNAGLGWDAEVVADIDARRREADATGGVRRRPTPRPRARDYVHSATRTFFLHTERRHPALRVLDVVRPEGTGPAGGAAPEGDVIADLHLVMVANTAPWTYLGNRPIGPFPQASFDRGLDLYALRNLRTVSTLHQARQIVSRRDREPGGRAAVHRHDLSGFRVSATRPVAVQADGEPLGLFTGASFRSVADALQVIC